MEENSAPLLVHKCDLQRAYVRSIKLSEQDVRFAGRFETERLCSRDISHTPELPEQLVRCPIPVGKMEELVSCTLDDGRQRVRAWDARKLDRRPERGERERNSPPQRACAGNCQLDGERPFANVIARR